MNCEGLVSLSIATAAQYLGIAEPTVRAWVRRGVLERAPGDGPVCVDRDSARRVGRGLVELRARAHDRDWLAALVDYLHDESDRRSEPVRKGLDELVRGEVEAAQSRNSSHESCVYRN